jgi:iron complex transport system ATP-binding protein
MRADILGDFLGHPIDIIQHGSRSIFIPTENQP